MRPAGADRNWSTAGALAHLWAIRREQGARAAALRALSELCYRRLTVIERRLDAPIEPVGTDLKVEMRALEGIEITAEMSGYALAPDELARRAESGGLCWAAFGPAGQILHSCWVAFGRAPVDYLWAQIELAQDTAFVYDAVTAGAARGHGLSAVRSAAMLADLRERGSARAISALLPENPAAAPPTRRVGYRPVGRISVAWVGDRRRYRAKLPPGLIRNLYADASQDGPKGIGPKIGLR